MSTREQYPHSDSGLYSDKVADETYPDLLKIYSVTYGVPFYFLAYDFKMNETLTPTWNNQSVIGRMDPIMTFKNMPRTINIQFKARQKLFDGDAPLAFNADELLHTIDHLKKCLYPRYDSNSVMVSPPLFRFQYKNLINAGEEQSDIGYNKGVLGIINTFSANFMTEPNKIYFPSDDKKFAYPKVFDININFNVMNENLVSTQQKNVLNTQYFYSYKHEHKHQKNNQAENVTQQATEGTGANVMADSIAAIVTKG